MTEHQSRRCVLNFNQTQMPPIRIQINHTLIPRSEPVKEFDRQLAGRFDIYSLVNEISVSKENYAKYEPSSWRKH